MDDKFKVDESSLNSAIKDCVYNRNLKFNGIKRYVRCEIKTDKYENRVFFLDDYRIYLFSVNKSLKPTRTEVAVHILEIKKLESLSKNQLVIVTNDNREFKLSPFNDDETYIDAIDDILFFYCKQLRIIFPLVSVKDILEYVNIQPEKRWKDIEAFYTDIDLKLKHEDLCGSYEKAYLCYCDLYSTNIFAEVGWDVNLIYTLHNSKEFRLNDFDYVNTKDALSLLAALRYNQWFESLFCEGIKLSSELQDEIQRLISINTNKLKFITIQHSNIKSDFLQKQLTTIQQQTKYNYKYTKNCLTSINYSRNTIEDKGAIYLGNILKEYTTNTLEYLSLSKCFINSKGVNMLALVLRENFANNLTQLDLSFNTLKDDPSDLFKFLSEKNSLTDLNLSGTDIDLEKLFMVLSKGCEANLKKLTLSNNTNHNKNFYFESFIHFFNHTQSLEYLDLSNCKLTGQMVQNLLICLQTNQRLKDVYLNLSSNDLGSSIRLFISDLPYKSCVTSMDLSDNSSLLFLKLFISQNFKIFFKQDFESDFDTFLNELSQSSVKHLWLSKNFVNIKPKYIKPIINSLVKLVSGSASKIESLWLVDCKLKTNLVDFLNELESCSALKYLDISGNDLGDFCINLLAKSLQVNRSIETLLFDRSNITCNALEHIIEALKRNFTLKTIQIPFTDICNLYPKTPEKIIETVKQMNDLIAQRNSNFSTNKCNIEQLLKTKVKLLNEEKFNESFGVNTNKENQLEIKEVVQTLNDSTIQYINENSIDKEFNQYTEQILEKFNTYTNNLNSNLNEKLKVKYNLNCQLLNSQDFIDNNAKINNIKKTIKDSMNSLFTQMHNEFCEIAYQLSSQMAEKIMQNRESIITMPSFTTTNSSLPSITVTQKYDTKPGTPTQPVVNINELSKFSFKNKNNPRTSYDSNNTTKSKRPISSQLQDLNTEPPTTPIISAPLPSTVNIMSTTQNDNIQIARNTIIDHESCHLYADILDEQSVNDILSTKTQTDSAGTNQSKVESSAKNDAYFVLEENSNVKDSSNTPRPAPRRAKPLPSKPQPQPKEESTTIFKTILGCQNKKTPSPQEEIATLAVNDDILNIKNDARKLEHLNKNRPKRPNVKKPSRTTHTTAMITNEMDENDDSNEDLSEKNVTSTTNCNWKEEVVVIKKEPEIQASNVNNNNLMSTSMFVSSSTTETPKASKPLNMFSPAGMPNKNVEQPKISLNVLENVKLRKTIKPVDSTTTPTAMPPTSNDDSTLATPPPPQPTLPMPTTPIPTITTPSPTVAATNNQTQPISNRFANRHSTYVSSASKIAFNNSQPPILLESTDENGAPKLKPSAIPPLKPPKPLPAKTQTEQTLGLPLVRLKPVNKQVDTTTATTTTETASTTTPPMETIQTQESTELLKPKQLTAPAANDNDKRTSVREIVQMLSEESKLRSSSTS